MKKSVFLLVLMSIGATSPTLGADPQERTAILMGDTGARWEVTELYAWTVPGGFYESRFRLAVATDTFHIAIPPENLISIEVMDGKSEIRYLWMGQEQSISGKIISEQVGGKSGSGYAHMKIKELRQLKFKEGSAAIMEEDLPSYEFETALVLTDGTKVAVANLNRISAQSYTAVPLSGVKEGTVFTPHNDVGFLQGKTAPTITFEDVKSMEFPTENTVILTLKQGISETAKEEKVDTVSEGDLDDFDLREGDLDDLDLGEAKSDAGKILPKNWAYGFTGIYSKGYFFIPAKHVKAIEFGVDQEGSK